MLKRFSLMVACLFTITSSLAAESSVSAEQEQSIQQQFIEMAKEPGAVMFTPPSGWQLTDSKELPKSVKVMVVGKGAKEYPPSINLSTEEYAGTLKQYLKIVKAINDSQGSEWKDLGTIRTDAGDASLSQVDAKSQWGETRLMHVILLKDGIVYILTAASLKDEFPKFYKDFFNSLRSLRINETTAKG